MALIVCLKDLVKEAGKIQEHCESIPDDVEPLVKPLASKVAEVVKAGDKAQGPRCKIHETKLFEGVCDCAGVHRKRKESMVQILSRLLYDLMVAGVDPTTKPLIANLK